MKTNRLHHFLSILMTLLVTMSSFSMTIRSHYCGDDLVEVSMFSDSEEACVSDDTCSMKKEADNFECCYDIIDVVESHEFLKTGGFDDLNTIQKNILTSYAYSELNFFESLRKNIIPNPHYKSPPLIFDLHTLDEVYLI